MAIEVRQIARSRRPGDHGDGCQVPVIPIYMEGLRADHAEGAAQPRPARYRARRQADHRRGHGTLREATYRCSRTRCASWRASRPPPSAGPRRRRSGGACERPPSAGGNDVVAVRHCLCASASKAPTRAGLAVAFLAHTDTDAHLTIRTAVERRATRHSAGAAVGTASAHRIAEPTSTWCR